MSWLLSITGLALVAVALRDIFHTLWHPGGFGTLARVVFKVVWSATRLWNRGAGSSEIAGPLGLVATLAAWTLLLVSGFGLVYLVHMPEGFFFGTSLKPQSSSDLVASMYLSMVALTTLGLGDIQPATAVLRVAVPLQALLGFLLLTAGISWVLQLYPALIRRRALARRLTSMSRHGGGDLLATVSSGAALQQLEAVRGELAALEMDLAQYPESYYFREAMPDLSLATALPCVAALVAAGARSSSADVRSASALLDDGLCEVLRLLRRDHLGDVGGDAETLAALARDHQHPLPD